MEKTELLRLLFSDPTMVEGRAYLPSPHQLGLVRYTLTFFTLFPNLNFHQLKPQIIWDRLPLLHQDRSDGVGDGINGLEVKPFPLFVDQATHPPLTQAGSTFDFLPGDAQAPSIVFQNFCTDT